MEIERMEFEMMTRLWCICLNVHSPQTAVHPYFRLSMLFTYYRNEIS